MTLEERVLELETKISFQEASLDELTRTVSRQENHISLLQDELRALAARVRDLNASPLGDSAEEPPPPHY